MVIDNISETDNTYTNNVNSNVTYSENTSLVKAGVLVSVMMVAFWTIFANGAIVVCYIVNRKRVWPIFSKQILCVTICDLCVGIAFALFTYISAHGAMMYEFCALLFYFFFTSQTASLFHIFGLCVQRCFVLSKPSHAESNYLAVRNSIIVTVLSWVISFAICIVPFILYGQPGIEVKVCILETVFSEDPNKAISLTFITYVVPHILTNILYIFALIRLNCVLKMNVFPSHENEAQSQTAQAMEGPSSLNHQDMLPAGRPNVRTNAKLQRAAFGTIGALLVMFNICILPSILLMLLGTNGFKIGRSMRFLAAAMFAMNSALNPLVYTIRIKWLRHALKKMFTGMLKAIHNGFCLTTTT